MKCSIYYHRKNKKNVIPITFLAIFFSLTTSGQNNSPYLFEESHSPTQTAFIQQMLRPESKMRNNYLNNPALLHQMIVDERYFFIGNPQQDTGEKNAVFLTFENSTGEHKGDYLPYEGKKFRDFSVRAHGYTRSNRSTFLGKGYFVTGKHKSYDWNTLRYADLYWPYIVADSTGGDMSYEKYNILCAYSFRTNDLSIGVSGEFTGDFAYRQNDPRIENITTWLTLKTGAAYTYKDCIFSAGIEYMRHRQHMDLHHFRTGQFAGFFIEYGFGMFDYIYSPIFRSMKQQQHMNDYGISLAFNSNPSKPLRMNTKMKYNYNLMTTEENNYKLNLYKGITHQLMFNYGMLWNNNVWGVGFFTDVETSNKKGRENLFERYISAEIDGVNVYDYKKIGHQDRYGLDVINGNADIKISRFFRKKYAFSLLGGIHYFMRDETYSEYDYQIKNGLITPSAGAEVNYNNRSYDLTVKGTWGHRTSVNNKYKVGINMEKHTEFQHAFTPYAYYANNADILTFEITASKHFPFGNIGIQAQMLYTKGKRLNDVFYDPARYNATMPAISRNTISLTPGIHNATWAKVALFAVF